MSSDNGWSECLVYESWQWFCINEQKQLHGWGVLMVLMMLFARVGVGYRVQRNRLRLFNFMFRPCYSWCWTRWIFWTSFFFDEACPGLSEKLNKPNCRFVPYRLFNTHTHTLTTLHQNMYVHVGTVAAIDFFPMTNVFLFSVLFLSVLLSLSI